MLPLSLSSDVTSDGPNKKKIAGNFAIISFTFCDTTFCVGSTYILGRKCLPYHSLLNSGCAVCLRGRMTVCIAVRQRM